MNPAVNGAAAAGFKQRAAGICDRRDAGAGNIGFVGEIACFEVARYAASIIEPNLGSKKRVGFRRQRVGAISEVSVRYPLNIRTGVNAGWMFIEEFGTQEMARRAGQFVVAEYRIIVETEIAEGVGRIEPKTVSTRTGFKNARDQLGAEAELDALMDALVEIDLRARAGASCRQALEFIVEIGPIDLNVPLDAGK